MLEHTYVVYLDNLDMVHIIRFQFSSTVIVKLKISENWNFLFISQDIPRQNQTVNLKLCIFSVIFSENLIFMFYQIIYR